VANDSTLGSRITELDATGYINFKKFHHKNADVVDSYNDHQVRVHMAKPFNRNLITHLIDRVLNPQTQTLASSFIHGSSD